ncbi:MAG: hypothetical protein AAF773_07160 [Cyanobacteria bacterium P01_D01_bin.115]
MNIQNIDELKVVAYRQGQRKACWTDYISWRSGIALQDFPQYQIPWLTDVQQRVSQTFGEFGANLAKAIVCCMSIALMFRSTLKLLNTVQIPFGGWRDITYNGWLITIFERQRWFDLPYSRAFWIPSTGETTQSLFFYLGLKIALHLAMFWIGLEIIKWVVDRAESEVTQAVMTGSLVVSSLASFNRLITLQQELPGGAGTIGFPNVIVIIAATIWLCRQLSKYFKCHAPARFFSELGNHLQHFLRTQEVFAISFLVIVCTVLTITNPMAEQHYQYLAIIKNPNLALGKNQEPKPYQEDLIADVAALELASSANYTDSRYWNLGIASVTTGKNDGSAIKTLGILGEIYGFGSFR